MKNLRSQSHNVIYTAEKVRWNSSNDSVLGVVFISAFQQSTDAEEGWPLKIR